MVDAQIAIVTGAADGIGLAMTKRFLQDGWRVAMLDEDAEELAHVSGSLVNIMPIKGDISVPEDVERMIGAVADRFGRIDALVHTSSNLPFVPLDDMTFPNWQNAMRRSADAAFLIGQACLPHLKLSNGAIVNVCSVMALRASPNCASIGSAQAAIVQLTRQQAVESGQWGVRSNAVCTALIDTGDTAQADTDMGLILPLDRKARIHEVTEPILFLCSSSAAYITGQTLCVDGGLSAMGPFLSTIPNFAN